MSLHIFNKQLYVASICAVMCFEWSMQYKTHIQITPEVIQDLTPHARACSEETGVPAIYMRKMLDAPLPDEEQVRKFLYCVCHKSGFTNEDGHINVEKMGTLQIMNGTVDEYKDILRECNKVTLDTNVDTMYAMGLCLHANTVYTV